MSLGSYHLIKVRPKYEKAQDLNPGPARALKLKAQTSHISFMW